MKEHTVITYSFEELSPEAQSKAIENLYDINVDYDEWCDYILDDRKEKLQEYGFNNPDIGYSGFWNQGDGASFTCKDINITTFMHKLKLCNQFRSLFEGIKHGYCYIDVSIDKINHHYSHSNTVLANLNYEEQDNSYNDLRNIQAQQLESIMTSQVRELSDQIYNELQKDYEYLTSEEAIKDTILANEYEFTENGELY